MKKESFNKNKKVAIKIINVLEAEFPDTSDIDGFICTLAMTVAATFTGLFGLGEDDVDLFAEHVKSFVRQRTSPETDTHNAKVVASKEEF